MNCVIRCKEMVTWKEKHGQTWITTTVYIRAFSAFLQELQIAPMGGSCPDCRSCIHPRSFCIRISTVGATTHVTLPPRLLPGLKENFGDTTVLATSAANVNASTVSRKSKILGYLLSVLSRKTTTCSLPYLYCNNDSWPKLGKLRKLGKSFCQVLCY